MPNVDFFSPFQIILQTPINILPNVNSNIWYFNGNNECIFEMLSNFQFSSICRAIICVHAQLIYGYLYKIVLEENYKIFELIFGNIFDRQPVAKWVRWKGDISFFISNFSGKLTLHLFDYFLLLF